MKSRIIQSRFYDDEVVITFDLYAQHLYMYLLTCQYINMCGIFQLSDLKIEFESKLNPKQLESAKESLQKAKKVLFFEGWVYVVNAAKNNNYRNSPSNLASYERELGKVPARVSQYFNGILENLDTGVDTTVPTSVETSVHSSIKSKSKSKEGSQFDFNWLKDFQKLRETDVGKAEALSVAGEYTKDTEFIFKKALDLIQYCESTGKKYNNYRTTLQVWIRKDLDKLPKKKGAEYISLKDF